MSIERRLHPRATVLIPGKVFLKDNPKKKFDAEILDLSVGGAFVHCTAPITLGQEIVLEIAFDKAHAQDLKGRVIQSTGHLTGISKHRSVVRWARGSSKSGFGVQFLELSSEQQEFLNSLLGRLSVAN